MNQSAFILIVSKKNRDGPCDVFWEKGKFLWLLNALWFILCVLSIKTIRSDSFFECVISHRMTLLYFYWDNDIKHQFEIQIKKICFTSSGNSWVVCRVSEPEPGASNKNRRLRNPETPCRFIIARINESIYFLITLGTTLLKSLFTNLLYIWALEAESRRAVGSETLVVWRSEPFQKNKTGSFTWNW